MTTFVNNRDGGLTNEEGHNRFPLKVWQGNVLEGFNVTQNSPLSMSVLVAAGTAKVNYNDYGYDLKNDANASVTIATADPSNPRIDRVVGYVDRSEPVQDVTPNNPGLLKFMAVSGTPSGTPSRPSDGTVDSAVGVGNPWFDLADVLVGAGVTTISNSNITDKRVPVSVNSSNGFFKGSIYFTSNGTYTKPNGLKFIEVEVIAGGGGGGGGAGGSNASMPGCGGGGGYSRKRILASSLSNSETVTVGAGGSGGTAGNNAGSSGGNSSFGSHATATGGGGGAGMSNIAGNNSASGGAGGTGSSGDLNVPGGDGSTGRCISGTAVLSGNSGGTIYANGVAYPSTGNTAGKTGNPYGGGGGGGFAGNTSVAGGTGGAGIVIVREYY